ncbi:hypothetical protein KSC_076820 [Ktedonobacter sp. SOSP1-52]|nr:hypothetical protein KSC_076820 [Ktedonobacter sp. SOSP1-52]
MRMGLELTYSQLYLQFQGARAIINRSDRLIPERSVVCYETGYMRVAGYVNEHISQHDPVGNSRSFCMVLMDSEKTLWRSDLNTSSPKTLSALVPEWGKR